MSFDRNPDAKIFNMSATPVRGSATSKEKNVAEIFFEGNIASTFDLSDAISSGVLPAPNYHFAAYFLDGELDSLEDMLENIEDPSERGEYENLRKQIKLEISKLDTEIDIFRKEIKKDGKYV